MPKFTFERLDTATRTRRLALLAQAPGWGDISTDRPQFAIFAPDGKLADWPLIDTYEEAAATCRDFNEDDDGDARSEAIWQARMSGDMEA